MLSLLSSTGGRFAAAHCLRWPCPCFRSIGFPFGTPHHHRSFFSKLSPTQEVEKEINAVIQVESKYGRCPGESGFGRLVAGVIGEHDDTEDEVDTNGRGQDEEGEAHG